MRVGIISGYLYQYVEKSGLAVPVSAPEGAGVRGAGVATCGSAPVVKPEAEGVDEERMAYAVIF